MKIAVVGIQGMGQGHLRGIIKGPVAKEVAGCDINEDVCRNVGKALNIPTFVGVPKLLSEFKPDGVVIATPPSRHGEVARACFERGIAVLTEKPIASTLAESEALVKIAAEWKIPYQCGFQLRYCGITRALQSVLDAGTLGTLSHISLVQISGAHHVAGYMSRARTGGIFYEKLCHQVDLFRFYFGEPLRVFASAAPKIIKHYEIEDNAVSVFQFKSGAQGTISFNTRRSAQVDGLSKPERKFEGHEAGHFYELTYAGEKGSATYDPWSETLDIVRYNHRDDLLSERVRLIRVREEFGEPSYDTATQDNDFFERVAAGKPPRFPAADALQSMVWTEKAEESLRRGGEWVS
jgi:predicted dehydrogenase